MTKTLKALSDTTRREILELLKEGPMLAGDIANHFDQKDATISHHLSVLKEVDLVSTVKNGRQIVYELNTSVLEEVLSWVMSIKGEK